MGNTQKITGDEGHEPARRCSKCKRKITDVDGHKPRRLCGKCRSETRLSQLGLILQLASTGLAAANSFTELLQHLPL